MLKGKTIWITRPEGQALSLVETLEQSGARVRTLPLLAIEPLAEDAGIRETVLALDRYDLVFFISTNAAGLGMALIDKYWPQFPAGTEIFCVGASTAAVIGKYGLNANCPALRMSSEALLDLPSLDGIDGHKALIVRGVGGRELLAKELESRGVTVDYLELYRRVCPDYEPGVIAEFFNADQPAAVIVTSAEALENLARLLARDGLDPASVPLYVSSQRIAGFSAEAGFLQTITMPGADDKAIIESLKENL